MESKNWIRRSQEFLEEAQNAFERKKYWFVCFNAHQAVEFYLKGKLLEFCGSFSFTHDLALLLNELSECLGKKTSSNILLSAQFLSPHYIESRYPGTKVINYDESLAENCLKMAKKIIEWVERL